MSDGHGVGEGYDPEFGTVLNARAIQLEIEVLHCLRLEIEVLHRLITDFLDGAPPIPIADVLRMPHDEKVQVEVSPRTLRLIRFALARARDSL